MTQGRSKAASLDVEAGAAVAAARRHLAVNVARLRAEKSWTQNQASDATGVDAKHLQKLEYAQSNPTLETLARVAHGFGVTLAELLATNAGRVPRRPRGRPRARGTHDR